MKNTENVNSTEKKPTLLNLPNDCLGEIFWFIDDSKIFFSIFCTCKELSNLVCLYTDNIYFELFSTNFPKTSRLFPAVKKLRVMKNGITTNEIITFLKELKNLKVLEFPTHSKICDKVLKILSNFQIMELEINFNYDITNVGISYLPDTVKKLRISELIYVKGFKYFSKMEKLEEFKFVGEINDEESFLSLPKSIEKLCFNRCSVIRSISINGYKKFFENSKFVKLGLADCSICDEVLSFFPETLRKLDLSSCSRITNKGIKYLKNTRIEKLNCQFLKIENFHLFIPKTVKNLNISWTNANDNDLKGLSRLKKLSKLDISSCDNISSLRYVPDGLEELIICNIFGCSFGEIRAVKSIKRLNIDFTEFDDGLEKLKEFENLEVLRCGNFSDSDVDFLPKSIKELDVEYNNLTQVGFKKLILIKGIKLPKTNTFLSCTKENKE